MEAALPRHEVESFSVDNNGVLDRSKKSDSTKKKKKKKDKDKDKEPRSSSRKLKKKPSQAQDGFDDLNFSRNSRKPDQEWDAFGSAAVEPGIDWEQDDSGFDSTPNGSGQHTSHATQATEATTVDGNELRDLPFSTIEVDPLADALFQSSSAMLEGFLKRNGHDENMAVATTVAFQRFLKQQHEAMRSIESSNNVYGIDYDDEEHRLDCVESMADDGMTDSFAPDSLWDDFSSIVDEKSRMMAEYFHQNDDGPWDRKPAAKPEWEFDEKAVMMIEYMDSEQTMKQAPDLADEKAELAAYHGEMLHGFLQRNGHGDDLAEQTAAAFRDFLKRQQDALAKLGLGSSPSGSAQGCGSSFSEPSGYCLTHENSVPHNDVASVSSDNGFGCPQRNAHFMRSNSRLSAKSNQSDGSGSGSRKQRNLVPKVQSDFSARSRFSDDSDVDTKLSSTQERPIHVQIAELTSSQMACMDIIRKQAKGRYNDALCLRFARCTDFKSKAALKVMKKFSPNMLQISIANMMKPLRNNLVYPLPGVLGRGGINMFYMRFSRLIPRAVPISTFSDLLIYVMNTMHEKERDCVKGIGLIADLTDFSMSNFSIPYMIKFFMLMQGRLFPVKVESILFTNAPKWFDKIWGILKQMMSSDFLQTSVHRVSINDLVTHNLEPGWERYMTDDLFLGKRNADQIVAEFIEQRKGIERSRLLLD